MVLEGERLAPDADVSRLAEQTEGYSGSDLRQLCVQAAMRPVRALLEEDSREAAAEAAEEAAEAQAEAEAEAGAADADADAAEPAGQDGGERQGSAASAAASPRTASLADSAGDALLAELAELEEEMGRDSAISTSSAAEQQGAGAAAAPRAEQAGAGAGSASGSPLQLVPRLDSLLRQAERIADVPRNPKTDLRPISMQASSRQGARASPKDPAV